LYGADVRTRWISSDPTETKNATVAWTGQIVSGRIRLYKRTWENPQPDAVIESLDFVSRMTDVDLFLIAITAE
jgi:hypothetical protein